MDSHLLQATGVTTVCNLQKESLKKIPSTKTQTDRQSVMCSRPRSIKFENENFLNLTG